MAGVLGELDTPDRLLIPEKLYGREREVETLLTSFDRIVKSGAPELVLVSGYSGIGKSSVVNELHKALVPPRGLFASGKFDQYKRDVPYATLAQAFQGRGARAQLSTIALQTKKALAYLLIVSSFLVVPGSTARADPLVLASPDARPTTFLADGKPTGILVDVVTEAFRRTGRSVDIKIMPWARCLSEARSGAVDGVFPIYRVPEREQFLTYPNEVLLPQLVVFFSRRDTKNSFSGELSEVRDVNIGIVRGASYGKKFDAAVKNGTLQNIDLADNIEQNLMKLMRGRVTLIANYRYGVLETARHLGLLAEIKEISPPIESVPSYLAFTKQRDFVKVLDDFQASLASMKQDGFYNRIIQEYLR